MIRIKALTWISVLMLYAAHVPAVHAGDMRAAHAGAAGSRKALIEKAANHKEEALAEAEAKARAIARDKAALEAAVKSLKAGIAKFKKTNSRNRKALTTLRDEEQALRKDLDETVAVNREFQGVVQANAKDLNTLLAQSLLSGIHPGRLDYLAPLIRAKQFPSMDDAARMAGQLFAEIQSSGEVALTRGTIVDRKGREQTADLLLLGKFTGIYTLGSETGFLLYSGNSQRYFALSRLPSARIRDNIRAYMNGESDSVFMDISKGSAIRQLAHRLSLAEQVPKGGALVWPLLVILGTAVLILAERIIFFTRRRTNTDTLMAALREKIADKDLEGTTHILESRKKKLIPKVLLSAWALKDRSRPEMENALQEAILGEIPAIERFLSTLGMLAAIAPLLGLLGTVTGMINTFHAITFYGTGDPRMMSGGISEALVTTMLGLSVAIPIMLAHTLLSRRVETQISRMEEKSVAFVNMIFKTRAQGN
ncbi:MAG: MotA/TolQ/ExbB proton channel family protein [Desulfobacterales bacterium]|nr:MotA/TolQ/ExbB proton channel family protein [Desulfobacterales bacterium]